jgi:hypothetical protein
MPLVEGPAVDFYTAETAIKEWERPLDELLAEITGEQALTPEELESMLEPDKWGALSQAQWRVRELIARQRWYILRNVWHWKSSGQYGGRAGAVEVYYTIGGKPAPFNGLDRIYAVLRDIAGADDPDATELQKSLPDALWREAWKLGAIEPISRKRARFYALDIYTKTRGARDLCAKPGAVPELLIVRR